MVFLVFLFAFVSVLLLSVLIPVLRRFTLDEPNARSSHTLPTPSGGGVVFVLLALIINSALLFTADTSFVVFCRIVLTCFPLAIVGFLDDKYQLATGLRYGIQLVTASLLTLYSPLAFPLIAFPLLIIAVSAVINFTNFMDGLDGLLSGCMAVSLITLGLYVSAPWPLWALVGSLLGFLLFNWSPANVFMGDVGSTFLGAVFAGLVLQSSSWTDSLSLLLVSAPLLADAFICVIRRLLARQRVLQAHRLHLFQRLHQAKWSHVHVSLLYIVATAVLSFALLFGGLPWVIGLAAVEFLVAVWLDQCVAVPFVLASQS